VIAAARRAIVPIVVKDNRSFAETARLEDAGGQYGEALIYLRLSGLAALLQGRMLVQRPL
jgi:hypothetical protein